MKITATHHVGLFTPNPSEMEAFYTQTLGLPVVKRWADADIIFLAAGDTLIELIGRAERELDDSRPAGFDHFAFHVADVDAAYAELEAAGVRMQSAPRDFENVRVAFFYDPDGNLLELVQDPA